MRVPGAATSGPQSVMGGRNPSECNQCGLACCGGGHRRASGNSWHLCDHGSATCCGRRRGRWHCTGSNTMSGAPSGPSGANNTDRQCTHSSSHLQIARAPACLLMRVGGAPSSLKGVVTPGSPKRGGGCKLDCRFGDAKFPENGRKAGLTVSFTLHLACGHFLSQDHEPANHGPFLFADTCLSWELVQGCLLHRWPQDC